MKIGGSIEAAIRPIGDNIYYYRWRRRQRSANQKVVVDNGVSGFSHFHIMTGHSTMRYWSAFWTILRRCCVSALYWKYCCHLHRADHYHPAGVVLPIISITMPIALLVPDSQLRASGVVRSCKSHT